MLNVYNEADKEGQEKVKAQLEKIFKKQTLEFEQHYADGGDIDLYFTATTSNGRQYKYCAECKDRKKNDHTSFDGYWMLEDHKYQKLMNDKKRGYKPLYINTTKDDWIMIWDMNSTPLHNEGIRHLPKSNMEDKGWVDKLCYDVYTKESVYNKPFI